MQQSEDKYKGKYTLNKFNKFVYLYRLSLACLQLLLFKIFCFISVYTITLCILPSFNNFSLLNLSRRFS